MIQPPAPVIGKETELADIHAALGSPDRGGVLILGLPGTGKSAIGRTVFAGLSDPAHWLTADRVLREEPYGALASLLDLSTEEGAAEEDLGAAITRTLTHGTGTRPVVFIDSAEHLDLDSASLLTQLAADQAIKLVVMALPGDVSPVLRGPLGSSDLLVRIDLGPLSQRHCAALLADRLGGPVATTVVEIVHLMSGGNPGLIDAAVSAGRDSGALIADDTGIWRLSGLPFDFTGRAAETLATWMSLASPRSREALELVTLAGSMPLDLLIDRGLAAEVDDLVSLGIFAVRSCRGLSVTLAMENGGRMLRETIPVVRAAALRASLQADAAAGFERSPTASYLGTGWALDTNAALSTEQLRSFARHAASIGEPQQALRALTLIPEDALDTSGLLELAHAHFSCGSTQVAEDLLLQATRHTTTAVEAAVGGVLAVRLHVRGGRPFSQLRGVIDRWGREIRAAITDRAEMSHTTAVDSALRVAADFLAGEVRRDAAEDRIDALLDTSTHPAALRLAQIVRVHLCSASGQDVRAAQLSCAGPEDPAITAAVAGLCDVLSALRPLTLVRKVAQRPTTDPSHMATIGGPVDFEVGFRRLMRLQPADAVLRMRAAADQLAHRDDRQMRAITFGIGALSAALSADAEAYREFSEALDALPSTGPYGTWLLAQALFAAAEMLRPGLPESPLPTAAASHPGRGRRAEAGARDAQAEADTPAARLRSLCAAAERAGLDVIAAQIRLLSFCTGDLSALRALPSLDADITESSRRYIDWLAVQLDEGNATALLKLRRVIGRVLPDAAAELDAYLRRLAAASPDSGIADLVADLAPSAEPPRTDPTVLTAREREVAELIVDGLTNAEIAAAIGVSVRTVEGHNSRIFRKLGITRRTALTAADLAD